MWFTQNSAAEAVTFIAKKLGKVINCDLTPHLVLVDDVVGNGTRRLVATDVFREKCAGR
jgi:hypothetical protein